MAKEVNKREGELQRVEPTRMLTPCAHDLSRILELVEQMNAVETTGIEPMAHPVDTVQRLRPDVVT